VYLNTGTWRPHARQGINKKGFLTWKNLTYTILYHPDHDPNSPAAKASYPTFETWTGSLLEVPNRSGPTRPAPRPDTASFAQNRAQRTKCGLRPVFSFVA
jgi:hypothetical protein